MDLFHDSNYPESFDEFHKLLPKMINDLEKSFVYYYFGKIKMQVPDFENAIKYFQKSIELDNKNSECWNNLGVLFMMTQRYNLSYMAY